MFALHICGYAELRPAIESFKPTHIISAIEQIDRLPGKHLHVKVSDVSSTQPGYITPTSNHLTKVLEFTQDLTDEDRLLVHCFAGQSRSTAFAIAALIQHGMTYREAFDEVSALRSILLPNKLIVRQTDVHFGLNGEFERLVQDYYHDSMMRTRRPPSGPTADAIAAMKALKDLFARYDL